MALVDFSKSIHLSSCYEVKLPLILPCAVEEIVRNGNDGHDTLRRGDRSGRQRGLASQLSSMPLDWDCTCLRHLYADAVVRSSVYEQCFSTVAHPTRHVAKYNATNSSSRKGANQVPVKGAVSR